MGGLFALSPLTKLVNILRLAMMLLLLLCSPSLVGTAEKAEIAPCSIMCLQLLCVVTTPQDTIILLLLPFIVEDMIDEKIDDDTGESMQVKWCSFFYSSAVVVVQQNQHFESSLPYKYTTNYRDVESGEPSSSSPVAPF
jgi:hypothetical protein